jgi:hypothetical protein
VAKTLVAKRRTRPKGRSIRVKILRKDPRLARKKDLLPFHDIVECPMVVDDATSARVAIINYNGALDIGKLLKDRSAFRSIAGADTRHDPRQFRFPSSGLGDHRVDLNAARTRVRAGRSLGVRARTPYAATRKNALYDRATGALHLLYLDGPDRVPLYTCLSHDIVARERPGWHAVSELG